MAFVETVGRFFRGRSCCCIKKVTRNGWSSQVGSIQRGTSLITDVTVSNTGLFVNFAIRFVKLLQDLKNVLIKSKKFLVGNLNITQV